MTPIFALALVTVVSGLFLGVVFAVTMIMSRN